MKVRIKIGDRSLALDLPEEGDVEVDLSELQPVAAQQAQLGPGHKTLYRHICSLGEEVVHLAPDEIEEKYGMVPIALGRLLGTLQKRGLIEVQRRSRAASGKVTQYRVKVLRPIEAKSPPETRPTRQSIVEDVRSECGELASTYFEAMISLADVDGHLIGVEPQSICEAAGTGMLHASVIEELDSKGYISIDDDGDGISATIIDWGQMQW